MRGEVANINSVLQTVEKLSRVIEKQFGCRLDYATSEQFAKDGLYLLLRRGEPVLAEDSIYFPVFLHGDLAGAARAVTTTKFEHNTLKHLHSVIRMLIENRLSRIENIEILSELEEHLLAQQERANTKMTNVLQFNDYQTNLYPLPSNKINPTLGFSFLIQSQERDDIFRMALEIHSRTGRYAFLPIGDLSPEAFASSEAFKSLGATTVFVQDIATLSAEQQETLLAYYNGKRDQDCPQIIAGTSLSTKQLKSEGHILPELLQFISVGSLVMNKPFSIYKSENLLDFFYDSLTGRTSI